MSTTPAVGAPPPAAGPPQEHRAGTARLRAPGSRRRSPLALLILPTLVLLVVALGYPIGWQLITSFREFGSCSSSARPARGSAGQLPLPGHRP